MRFANGSYSEENDPWFRYSNLQVGMVASIPSSRAEELSDQHLQQAKLALLSLRAPAKSGVESAPSDVMVGFVECLPKLMNVLKHSLQDDVATSTPQHPLFQLEKHTPSALNISEEARSFTTERNSLDNQFREWAQHAFPEAGCESLVHTSQTARMVSPHVVHQPAENEKINNNAVPVSWTASAGSDFVDVHICEEKVLDSSRCVLVRSTMSAHGLGESDNALTLRIGGETLGNKNWAQKQEPCEWQTSIPGSRISPVVLILFGSLSNHRC
jgi:hypothetical protein